MAKILVVEDNITNQIVARNVLKMDGVHVDVACNGREAVDAVGQREALDALRASEVAISDANRALQAAETAAREARAAIADIAARSAEQKQALDSGQAALGRLLAARAVVADGGGVGVRAVVRSVRLLTPAAAERRDRADRRLFWCRSPGDLRSRRRGTAAGRRGPARLSRDRWRCAGGAGGQARAGCGLRRGSAVRTNGTARRGRDRR